MTHRRKKNLLKSSKRMRWRAGETVNLEEKMNLQEPIEATTIGAPPREPEKVEVFSGPVPATPSGIMIGSLSNEERQKLEEERERLYQQLDEKDEEINQQSQLVEKLKEQILEQEVEAFSGPTPATSGAIMIESLSNEDRHRLEEERERLYQQLDEKDEEINQQSQLVEKLKKQILEQEESQLHTTSSELQKLKDVLSHQRRRITEMLTNLLEDLEEIRVTIGGDGDMKLVPDTNGLMEDEFTVAMVFISKIKSEVKNVVQRCQNLETFQVDCNKKITEYEKELGDCRLLISQHEARMKSLQESMKEAENKKRALEEDVDALREECAKLKAAEHVHAMANKEKAEEKEEANKMRVALEQQMDQLRDAHQKQVGTLRDEIMEKQTLINELRDLNQKCTLAHQQMQQDYEKLKQEENDKSNKLQELILTNERREQPRKDLQGLEDGVAKELQTLHNLRKFFVQDLQTKTIKSVNAEDNENDGRFLAQKQKISFLENNLDQLTKVNKQLVRDNADLRCEGPKLEKRLRATMERVKALETALKEAKQGAMLDRKRYQYEVDRIKEAARQKNLARRGPSAQIAKPIRAGQHHTHLGSQGVLRSVPISTQVNKILSEEDMRKRRSIGSPTSNKADSDSDYSESCLNDDALLKLFEAVWKGQPEAD